MSHTHPMSYVPTINQQIHKSYWGLWSLLGTHLGYLKPQKGQGRAFEAKMWAFGAPGPYQKVSRIGLCDSVTPSKMEWPVAIRKKSSPSGNSRELTAWSQVGGTCPLDSVQLSMYIFILCLLWERCVEGNKSSTSVVNVVVVLLNWWRKLAPRVTNLEGQFHIDFFLILLMFWFWFSFWTTAIVNANGYSIQVLTFLFCDNFACNDTEWYPPSTCPPSHLAAGRRRLEESILENQPLFQASLLHLEERILEKHFLLFRASWIHLRLDGLAAVAPQGRVADMQTGCMMGPANKFVWSVIIDQSPYSYNDKCSNYEHILHT